MPPRDPSLPEGTDHIIDTNIGIDGGGPGSGGGGGSTGGSGGTSGTTGSGTSGSGTSSSGSGGSGGSSAFQFDKNGSGGVGKAADGIAGQVREQIGKLTDQASERARGFADDGKKQATDFLQTVAQIVSDAAGSVETRLGSQYAGFGNRASDSINSLASSLDERSVDDLIDDARSFVKRSPVVAIGVAAVVGFAVARLVRSSIAEMTSSGETGNGATGNGATGGGGTTGGNATGSAGTSSGSAA